MLRTKQGTRIKVHPLDIVLPMTVSVVGRLDEEGLELSGGSAGDGWGGGSPEAGSWSKTVINPAIAPPDSA